MWLEAGAACFPFFRTNKISQKSSASSLEFSREGPVPSGAQEWGVAGLDTQILKHSVFLEPSKQCVFTELQRGGRKKKKKKQEEKITLALALESPTVQRGEARLGRLALWSQQATYQGASVQGSRCQGGPPTAEERWGEAELP